MEQVIKEAGIVKGRIVKVGSNLELRDPSGCIAATYHPSEDCTRSGGRVIARGNILEDIARSA